MTAREIAPGIHVRIAPDRAHSDEDAATDAAAREPLHRGFTERQLNALGTG
ncbi:hypothetical protein ACIBL8_21925 [Streptomyces sp. NPDC050523]|uniref:hypothetical protein n=1 Tax=Streptomyces sp. NPDC050523 TaxID=3365622 RepID=UPI00378B1B77